MKYAIAQTSGKQFLLKPGQWYDVDFIKDGKIGDYIYLNKVLFFRNDNKIQIGQPFLENSKIPAKIIQQVKGKKITVLKTKPKKRYTHAHVDIVKLIHVFKLIVFKNLIKNKILWHIKWERGVLKIPAIQMQKD